MGEPSNSRLRSVPLERLRSAFARASPREPVAAEARIDLARPFLPPSVMPLHYTPSFARLTPAQALRANQLTGLCFNELITFFETAFAPAVLAALRQAPIDDDLAACLRHFLDEEARHSAMFQRLNRLSAPGWYDRGPFHLVSVPRSVGLATTYLARRPAAFPAVLWLMLAMEEHSIEVSRRFVAAPTGQLEPSWAAAYHSHLEDEVRHVQVDWRLIEAFHAGARWRRRFNAALVTTGIARFLLAPSRSGARVVAQLVAEFPELRPHASEMVRDLRRLDGSADYQAMMYSRETTPLTFALFDRFPEFRQVGRALTWYAPRVSP